MTTLDVYFHNTHCAHLTEGAGGVLQFRYLKSWLESGRPPVSLRFPVEDVVYGPGVVAPFVAAFLPEGEGLRSRLEKLLHVDAEHDFGLLSIIGRESAGALSFWPEDESPLDNAPQYSALSLEDFCSWREHAHQLPLQFPGKTIRLSLAGAQAKTALFFDHNDHPFFPENGAPTSHILKPRIQGCVPSTVFTELLTMRVARAVLGEDEVPSTDIWQNCYRIRRFDRPRTGSGVRRLHQEDFCLALGRMPSQKYEMQSPQERLLGPCFNLLDKLGDDGLVVSPALERLRLLNQVILNVLLHNPDAHLKNYALLYLDNGSLRVSPLYDSLCTFGLNFAAAGGAWAQDAGPAAHTRQMSLSIGNALMIDQIGQRDWEYFAIECGFTGPFVRRRVHAMAEAVSSALQPAMDSVLEKHPIAERAAQAVRSAVATQVRMALN
jgi:serine/threonine-protein kinase HipA